MGGWEPGDFKPTWRTKCVSIGQLTSWDDNSWDNCWEQQRKITAGSFRSWNPDRKITSDFKICGSPRVLSIMTHVTSKICQICHYFHVLWRRASSPCPNIFPGGTSWAFERHGGLLFLKSETRLSDALIGTKTYNTLQTACKFRRVYSLKCDPISRVFALKNLREKNTVCIVIYTSLKIIAESTNVTKIIWWRRVGTHNSA